MMKKNKIILILMSIVVLVATAGIGAGFIRKSEKNKLISCEHIDSDIDMICDLCSEKLPFSNYVEYDEIESEQTSTNEKVQVTGVLIKNSQVEVAKLNKEDAVSLAQSYKKDILPEQVVDAFDIDVTNENLKYQPTAYGQKVKVKLSNLDMNLDIDDSKTYALMHIMNNENYEILPISKLTAEEIEFTTGSFSTYIIITVNTRKITFDGENYKVFDTNGEEIVGNTTVAEGTALNFNIVPNNNYGIASIESTLASGDSAITTLGNVRGKVCNISSVDEDIAITVTTALAPSITTQPATQKVIVGNTATFKVVAENATTYQWQYRENENTYWKNVSSSSTSATLSVSTYPVMEEYTYRCLVGNTYFTEEQRVSSDIAALSLTPATSISVGEIPIIMEQPTLDLTKVKVQSGTAKFSVVAMGTNLTFTWQYRESENDYWKDATSTQGSSSTSTPSNSTTEKPLKKSTFTTKTRLYSNTDYQYRCLVGNNYYKEHDAVKSDIVTVSVAEGDISIKAAKFELEYTKQPETQKINYGEKATFEITAKGANKYQWQYKSGDNIYWEDVTSSIATGYNTAKLTMDTSKMTSGDCADGFELRCVIWNSSIADYKKTSDVAALSVVQPIETESVYAEVKIELMEREGIDGYITNKYVIGAYRAGKTEYTPDLITKVIFTDTAASNATVSWDVSSTSAPDTVTSYLVPSTMSGDTQCYAQYFVATNTINAKYTCMLFDGYSNLTEIKNIEYLTTNNATNMFGMFRNCKKLKTLDISRFDTSNVTLMESMFSGCSALKELNLGTNFDTSNVTSMSAMFYSCGSLTKLNLGENFNTIKVKNMSNMLQNCSSLTTLDLGKQFDTRALTTTRLMFRGCTLLSAIDLGEKFDTSKVTDMSYMFASCTSIETLNLGTQFNTSNVTNMYHIFYNCKALTELDLGNQFDTSKITNMAEMFADCQSLKSVDVSMFNTSKVTNFDHMFKGCYSLTELNVTSFDTSSAKCMASMFDNCRSLTFLDLSSFDTSALDGVTGAYKWADTGKALTDTTALISNCTNLRTVILGEKFTRLDGKYIFLNNTKLERIISLRSVRSESDLMQIATDNSLSDKKAILYVPTTSDEALYEANSTYISLLGAEKIKPFMSLLGDNPAKMEAGTEYVDAGVTVFDWDSTNATNYNDLGYTVETAGLPIDTSTLGDKTITYTLKYTNKANETTVVDTQTRTIAIALGNYRVGEKYYSTLESAIESITTTGTVEVMRDCTDVVNAIIPTNKNITLDLSTYALTKNERGIVNYGVLNITGAGSLVGNDINLIQNDRELNIETATIELNVSERTGEYEILFNNYGAVTNINSGTLTSTVSAENVGIIQSTILDYGGTINVNGGTIAINRDTTMEDGLYTIALYMHVNGGTLNVNGGTISAVDNGGATYTSAIYISDNAILTIGTDDGIINDNLVTIIGEGYGVYTDGSNIVFYDGLIKGGINAVDKTNVVTPNNTAIYNYHEEIDGMHYEVASLKQAWNISKNAGVDNVWAYLINNEDNTKYQLLITGMGEMKDFTTADTPWNSYTSKITEISIDSTVTSIGNNAFRGTAITTITLPTQLKAIGDFALADTKNMTGILTIPVQVASMGANPFMGSNITGFSIATGNTNYKVENIALLTYDGKTVVSYPAGNGTATHIINANVENIADYAYAGAKNIAEVYLKSTSIIEIGTEAFTNLQANSVIYTMSKDVADKFVSGTHYTAENTKIYYPPMIDAQPTDVSVNAGHKATFTVTATAGNPADINYQWQYRTSATGTWTNVTDAQGTNGTTATFTTTGLTQAMNGYEYRCVLSNSAYPNAKMTQEKLVGTISNSAKVTVTASNYSVDGVMFDTLAEAYASITGTKGTIKVEADNTDTSELIVESGKDITINTNGHTITLTGKRIANLGTLTINGDGVIKLADDNTTLEYLISTYGTLNIEEVTLINNMNCVLHLKAGILNIKAGQITLNDGNAAIIIDEEQATVNVTGGKIISETNGIYCNLYKTKEFIINISGGTIESNGYAIRTDEKQTGIVNISGGELKSKGSYAIRNYSTSNTVNITGGTLISEYGEAINNPSTGKIVIGSNDETVSTTTPSIIGKTYAITSPNGFGFYDGILKGRTNAYSGDITSIADGYDVYKSEETINGKKYETAYLAPYLMIRNYSLDATSKPYATYVIGAEEAGYTQFTSDKIKSVTFVENTNVPAGATSWDVSEAQDESILAWVKDDNLYIGSDNKVLISPLGLSMLFADYTNCISINNFEIVDVSRATSMYGMFKNIKSMQTFDWSNIDTSKITKTDYTFAECTGLKELDLRNFNTTNVTSMKSMFENCTNLETIVLGENFTKISGANMFAGDTSLSRIIAQRAESMTTTASVGFDTATNAILYVPNQTAKVNYEATTPYETALGSDRIRTILELNGDNPTYKIKGESYTEKGATVAGFDSANATNYTKYGYSVTVDKTSIDTSEVCTQTITYTLNYTENGTTKEVMNITREIVIKGAPELMERETATGAMLGAYRANEATTYNASQVTKVIFTNKIPTNYVDSWDVSLVNGHKTVMSYIVPSELKDGTQYYDQYIVASARITAAYGAKLFYGYSNMTEIDNIEYISTQDATSFESMFSGCTSLEELDLRSFETSNVTVMAEMFNNCSSLLSLDVTNFNTSEVTAMYGMFTNCSSLTKLDLSSFDTSNAGEPQQLRGRGPLFSMFQNCTNLETLVLGEKFNTLNGYYMFNGCENLQKIISNRSVETSSDMMAINSVGIGVRNTPATLYVSSQTAEALYEANSSYINQFTADRIKSLLSLIGDERVKVNLGGSYTEYGYKIADEMPETLEDENIGDYRVTITGVEDIDFSTMGVYDVVYTLEYKNPYDENATYTTFMSLTRKVQVGGIEATVKVEGKNEYDSTLTAKITSSTIPEENYTYQWYICDIKSTNGGTPIEGATNKTYTVGKGLVGKYIYVEVTGNYGEYEEAKFYDLADEANNVSDTIAKKVVTLPKDDNSLVYNGEEQEFIPDGYNEKYMEVTGNTGTDAGTYKAEYILTDPDDCEWDKGEEITEEVIWTIAKKSIAAIWDGPFTFTYNGTEQGPEVHTESVVDGEVVTLTKYIKVDAGNYIAKTRIASVTGGRANANNYVLINETASFKINKATPEFVVTPTQLNITQGNTGILNYTSNVESTITVESADTSVATAGNIDLTGKTIEIISKGTGSTIITVTLDESINYSAATATVVVGTLSANYTDGTNYYETLASAFAGAKDGAIIIQLNEVTENTVAVVESSKTLTLKLNGNNSTIKVNDFITVKGNLTIEGLGTISQSTTDGTSTSSLIVVDGGTLTLKGAVEVNGSNTAITSKGIVNVSENVKITGITGIVNKGKLTFGVAGDVTQRDLVEVIATQTAIENVGEFYWYDGQITANAATIYSGVEPILEESIAICSEINGNKETRYVVRDTEAPVIENIISQTDWVKNSQTLEIIARDNIKVTGYALTETNEMPALDSNVWNTANTFTVTENKSYFVWVKDAAGNVVSKEFVAKWICLEIWDTTGESGTDTRAILKLDGTLLFEVVNGTIGYIKDYTVSNAPWSNDTRVTSVVVSEGIAKIGEYGLSNMIVADSITLPRSLTEIAESALYRTNNYSSINISGNTHFTIDELSIYDISKTTLYSYSKKNTEIDFTIPDTVKTLVTGLFYENGTLVEIRTNKNITSVGEDAFEGFKADVYYYTSCETMKEYALANSEEANFIAIDDVKPVIESFVINNDDISTISQDVTLTIIAKDDVKVSNVFISEQYYTDEEIRNKANSEWISYNGTEYPYTVSSGTGTKTVYVWVKDSSGNISSSVNDSIFYGDIEVKLLNQAEIVQYVDTTGKDYYKYIESVQGGYTSKSNVTVNVTGSVNHKVSGEYEIKYSVMLNDIEMQTLTRTVNVIENSWTGAKGTTQDEFTYVIHTNGKYAKITGYTGEFTRVLRIPASVTLDGTEYKVIDVESIGANRIVETVELPDTLINIGNRAFAEFNELENVDIPDAVMSIDENAFASAGLMNGIFVKLGSNFREIKAEAFKNARISDIDFGSMVKYLGDNAFANVRVPENFVLKLPASLDALGLDTFESTKIYDITVEEGNNKFIIDDDGISLLTNDEEMLVLYPIASDFEEYDIPQGVTTIGRKAFKDAEKLKIVNVSSSANTVNEYAFEGATNLEKVNYSELLTNIGEYAFLNSGVTSFAFNRNLNNISKGAFENSKLTDVSIHSKITSIKAEAFKGITTLKSVVIEGKPSISISAFENCTSLKTAVFTNNTGIVTIADKTSIPDSTTIYVPTSMEVIYESDSIYSQYENCTEKIQPILELIGNQEIVWTINNEYVEDGVKLAGETLKTSANSSTVKGLELVIDGTVDPSKSLRNTIVYIAKYNGVEVDRIERIVDIQDNIAPVIESVTTDSDWVSPYQTFVVKATDNIAVTAYIITTENTVPSVDDSRWQTSEKLKVDANQIWYIFAKDAAGNISTRYQVISTWVAAGKWDVSKNQDNSVHGIITLDGKTLIIKGNGETKNYAEKETPWYEDYKDTVTTITVEDGVTSIGDYLLGYMPNVLTITLPNTLEKVIDGAFAYTNNFENIELGNNTHLVYENGTLYNADKTELYVHTTKHTNDYEIPSNVQKICAAAFANSIYISRLDLTNVKEIQSYAFNGCTHFANQYIPKTLNKIGEKVFAGTRGPIYYYSSCDAMVEYVKAYGSETEFIEIDDIKPVIKNFVINNNEVSTDNENVTLNIDATDNKAISKIIIETTLSENITSGDPRWTDYAGEKEVAYTLTGGNGIKILYVWVMDTSGNICEQYATDTIILGANDFAFEHNDTIVQYVDRTGKGYYEFNEEVQGNYSIETEGVTVTVNANIDVTTVGEKQIVYSLDYYGTPAGEFYKTVDVIEDSWGTTIFSENGFDFVKHTDKNYAKIVKYSGSTNVVFPEIVTDGGIAYRVIEIESLDENPVVDVNTTTVELPTTIIHVGKNAFVNCTKLESINIEYNVLTIEENAFKNTGLKALDTNKNVRVIKEGAFENAHITTLNNSQLLKSIETRAFRNALDTERLTILASIDNIAEGAFAGSLIDKIVLDDENVTSKFKVHEDSLLLDTTTGTLIQYATGKGTISLECPSIGIKKIGEGAFMNATNIQKLSIKDNYTMVGREAFRNTGLTIFELNSNIQAIPEYLFADCTSLSTVILENARSIKANAFENTSALKQLVIFTSADYVCDIDNVSLLNENTKVYVLEKEMYKESASWTAIADRIYSIFRLNGDENITIEAGTEYIDSGVYAIDVLFASTSTYPDIDNITVEINSNVNTAKLGNQTVNYILKLNGNARTELSRNVKVQDTTPPVIEKIITLDVAQAQREKFEIIASDNHKIAGYAITQTDTQPILDSDVWSTSNVVYATQNGEWFVWVKDEAGNVAMETVKAENICAAIWDVGVVPNKVFASISFDNTIIFEGEGAVRYFAKEDIPWKDYLEKVNKIEVREGVTELQKYTLADMTNVGEISLPKSLTKVETSTFAKTNNFYEITFPNGTETFIYDGYTLYSMDKSILYVHSNRDQNITYTIDENVKTIGEYAFANNSNIVTITTTSNPTLLEGAFNNNNTLEKINGEIGGTRIESYVFENCSKLSGIEMSKDVTYIGSYAFSNCNMITEIEMILCTELKTLDHHAFANLKNLQTLKVYRTIANILADEENVRNVFEKMGSNFPENAKVYYYEGCNAMEEYAKYYPDINVDFIMIDEIGPRLMSLKVTNRENGTYSAGTVLEITAIMSENFLTIKGTIPELSIEFGSGSVIKLQPNGVDGRNIKYTYTITKDDLGQLECVSFDGELYDELDNKSEFKGPKTIDGNIYARSGVLLESDFEENKYFPRLSDATEYITSTGKLTMLLNEDAMKVATFKANTLVTLDINGKKVSLNCDQSEDTRLIKNNGTLTVIDSGAGELSTISTGLDACAIENEGTLKLVSGVIRAQTLKTGLAYGVLNKGEVNITGGTISAVNTEGTSYGMYNEGTLKMENGTITSSTIEGKTYALYVANGNVNVTGGQITSRLLSGNKGTTTGVYIEKGTYVSGKNDESISKESPIIYSTKDGLRNVGGKLEFYDGVIEGEAYRSLYTNEVKVVPGYALIKKLVGDREKAYLDFDVSKPIIELKNLTPDWTNDKVTIQAKFIDEESGVQNAYYGETEVTLVNNMITVEVEQNGTYTFKAIDFAGNTAEESITITNIDKESPTFENLSYTAMANQKEVTLTVTVKDNASGVRGYLLSKYEVEPTKWKELNKIMTKVELDISVTSNGKYYLYAIDDAGNIGKYNSVIDITDVDASAPVIKSLEIVDNDRGFANSSVVMIKVDAEDDTGVKEILISNKLLTNNQVLDSEEWVPYTEDVIWTLPIGDGEKTIYVWVKDKANRISKTSTATTKLLAQYIGNNGENSTSFKFLSKDANYNYGKELTADDLYIKVKDTTGAETYTGDYGEGIVLAKTPVVYGPIQEGSQAMSGRYYYVTAQNIAGEGIVYLCFRDTVEVDKAGNKIATAKLELETDVVVELNKPVITVSSTTVTVTDADNHSMNVIKIDGKTIKLSNGSITKSDLKAKYDIELVSGTKLETIDKCGNTAVYTIN